jgi:hypothetical protein
MRPRQPWREAAWVAASKSINDVEWNVDNLQSGLSVLASLRSRLGRAHDAAIGSGATVGAAAGP